MRAGGEIGEIFFVAKISAHMVYMVPATGKNTKLYVSSKKEEIFNLKILSLSC